MASGIRSSPGSARVFSSRVARTDLGELTSVAQSYRQMTTIAQTITSELVTPATSPPAFGDAVRKLNDAATPSNTEEAGISERSDIDTSQLCVPEPINLATP